MSDPAPLEPQAPDTPEAPAATLIPLPTPAPRRTSTAARMVTIVAATVAIAAGSWALLLATLQTSNAWPIVIASFAAIVALAATRAARGMVGWIASGALLIAGGALATGCVVLVREAARLDHLALLHSVVTFDVLYAVSGSQSLYPAYIAIIPGIAATLLAIALRRRRRAVRFGIAALAAVLVALPAGVASEAFQYDQALDQVGAGWQHMTRLPLVDVTPRGVVIARSDVTLGNDGAYAGGAPAGGTMVDPTTGEPLDVQVASADGSASTGAAAPDEVSSGLDPAAQDPGTAQGYASKLLVRDGKLVVSIVPQAGATAPHDARVRVYLAGDGNADTNFSCDGSESSATFQRVPGGAWESVVGAAPSTLRGLGGVEVALPAADRYGSPTCLSLQPWPRTLRGLDADLVGFQHDCVAPLHPDALEQQGLTPASFADASCHARALDLVSATVVAQLPDARLGDLRRCLRSHGLHPRAARPVVGYPGMSEQPIGDLVQDQGGARAYADCEARTTRDTTVPVSRLMDQIQ